MTPRVLALVVLAGCSATPDTPCGMYWSGDPSDSPWGPADLAAVEAGLLGAMAGTDDERLGPGACGQLAGWLVVTHHDASWGRDDSVFGEASCPFRTITIGTGPRARLPETDARRTVLRDSALAHEMVHAIQGCDARAGDGRPQHENWNETGIAEALCLYVHEDEEACAGVRF